MMGGGGDEEGGGKMDGSVRVRGMR
jgi:hypothetical protein